MGGLRAGEGPATKPQPLRGAIACIPLRPRYATADRRHGTCTSLARKARERRKAFAGGRMARTRLLAYTAITACGLLFASIGVSANESGRAAITSALTADAPSHENSLALFALDAVCSIAGVFYVLLR